MTEKSDVPKAPVMTKSPIWWLLAASLTLNFLVAGVLVGTFINGGWHREPPHHWRKGGLSWLSEFAQSLPTGRRTTLDGIIAQPRTDLKTLNEQLDAAREAVKKVLRVEPFDEDAFKSAVTRVYDIRTSASRTATDAFISTVSAMTGEERKAFASWRRKHQRKPNRM